MALGDDRGQADFPYGYAKTMAAPFDEALQLVRKELQSEGFGILSEIDLQAKPKEKLANLQSIFVSMVIWCACHPKLAYRLLHKKWNRTNAVL